MPVVVRDSGQMWNKDGELEDTKCIIPDRSYARMYQEVFNYVKTKGQFDVEWFFHFGSKLSNQRSTLIGTS